MSELNELDLLKQRALNMGISFHPSIGLDALKAKVNAKLAEDKTEAGEEEKEEEEADDTQNPNGSEEDGPADPAFDAPDEAPVAPLTPKEALATNATPAKRLNKMEQQAQLRKQQRSEQLKLVRVRVACLNPAKKELQGEIITFSNRILGEVKKFVPFGEGTENGYHVPWCIYQVMKDRKFVQLRAKKAQNAAGIDTVTQKIVSEFSIEILPDLTKEEIATLAAAQAAGHSIDN